MSHISRRHTFREQQVYDLAVAGKTNKEIAAELEMAPRTVRFHLTNIYIKNAVENRLQLICEATRLDGKLARNAA